MITVGTPFTLPSVFFSLTSAIASGDPEIMRKAREEAGEFLKTRRRGTGSAKTKKRRQQRKKGRK